MGDLRSERLSSSVGAGQVKGYRSRSAESSAAERIRRPEAPDAFVGEAYQPDDDDGEGAE